MKLPNLNQALTHLNLSAINVMQILVLQEVERQFQKLTPHQALYVQPIEVATHALNHLPSLYAASQDVLSVELEQASQQYHSEITTVVRQSLTAVQQDPQNDWIRLLCL